MWKCECFFSVLLYLLFILEHPAPLEYFWSPLCEGGPRFWMCCNLAQSVPPHKSSRGLKYVLCWQYNDSEFGCAVCVCKGRHWWVVPVDDLICDFFDQFHCCIQSVRSWRPLYCMAVLYVMPYRRTTVYDACHYTTSKGYVHEMSPKEYKVLVRFPKSATWGYIWMSCKGGTVHLVTPECPSCKCSEHQNQAKTTIRQLDPICALVALILDLGGLMHNHTCDPSMRKRAQTFLCQLCDGTWVPWDQMQESTIGILVLPQQNVHLVKFVMIA